MISRRKIWAIEMVAAVDSLGTLKTFYCATSKLVTNGGDTPAHTAFIARVTQPGIWTAALFKPRAVSGAATSEPGEIVLANEDGALDSWMSYGWAGRTIIVRVGIEGAAYPSQYSIVLRGVIDQVLVDDNDVVVIIRGRLASLDQPVISVTYAGNNVLPAGIEGDDDLQGQTKPLCMGVCRNIELVCVNSSRLIYQASYQSIDTAVVFDRGVALTAGAAYTSREDMEANAPAAGAYRVWLAGGCVRLGSTPSGAVTADVTAGTGSANYAGSMMQALVQRLGQSAVSADVTALNTAAPWSLGVYVPAGQDATVREVMDQVAGSVGAWYVYDHDNTLQMGRLVDPATKTATYQISAWQVKSIKRVSMRDGGGVPAWRVSVGYARCQFVQTDLAGGSSASRKSFCRRAERVVTSSASAVKLQHLQAAEISVSTLIDSKSSASSFAAGLLAMHAVQRHMFNVSCDLDDIDLNKLRIGEVVKLYFGRYGLAGGKNVLITEATVDRQADVCEFTVWG